MKILFSIFCYNESYIFLKKSLNSILNSLDEMTNPSYITISIIYDGKGNIEVQMLDYINCIRMNKHSSQTQINNYSCISLQGVNQHLNDFNLGQDIHIDLLIYIKEINKGKIDSHDFFYKKVIPIVNPEYLICLDIGTIIPNNTCKYLHNVEDSKNIDAIITAIEIDVNFFDASEVVSYQIGEFIFGNIFISPSEILLNYVSVMPGQFYILLWKNVNKDIINKYLEDIIAPSSPLEHQISLAEDRRLCLGILQQNTKRIKYQKYAVAKTDPCLSFNEILSQRKRWINSIFATQIKILTGRNKIGLMLGTFIFFIFNFLCPTWTFILCTYPLMQDNELIKYTYVLSLIYFLYSSINIFIGSIAPANIYFYNIYFMFLINIYYLFNNFLISYSGYDFLIISLIISIILRSCVYIGASRNKTVKFISFLKYISSSLFFNSVMMAYAFSNSDDLSWGTKGLIGRMSPIKLKEQLINYKLLVLMPWIVINILISVICLLSNIVATMFFIFYFFLLCCSIFVFFKKE
jgi:chitin synthase